MVTDDQRRERRRVGAAVDAVLAADALLPGGHINVVEDALALLHRHVLEAGSLDELGWIADRPGLRARLTALSAGHASMPFLQRASSELRLALDVVRPRPSLRLPRLRSLVDALANTQAVAQLGPVVVIAANLAVAAALVATALLWAAGLRELPEPFDRWVGDGAVGYRPVCDLLAHATVNLLVGGAFARWLASSLEQRQRARDARRTPTYRRRHALARKVARASWALAAFGSVAACVGAICVAPEKTLLETVARHVGATALFTLPVFVASLVTFVAASALAYGAQLFARLVARALPAADPAPAWESPTSLWLARWRFDRAVARRVAEEERRRASREREVQRVADLAAKLRDAMADEVAAAETPTMEAGIYRAAPRPSDATELLEANANPVHEAWHALLVDPAHGAAFRADFLACMAQRASANPSDDHAHALVRTCAAALRRAGVPLSARELNEMARLGSTRHGGFRRLQQIAGVAVLTNGEAPPVVPLRVEVAAPRVRVLPEEHWAREMPAFAGMAAPRRAR